MQTNSLHLSTKHWWPPSEIEAEEFLAYSAEIDENASLAQFDRVASSCRGMLTGADSGASLAAFLRERIESATPTSVIRLGDADGNVLFSQMDRYKNLADYCLRKISHIYFGDQKVMPVNSDFFASVVIDAVTQADVVGAPERGTIARSFRTPLPEIDTRGMCGMRGVYNYMAARYDCSTLLGKLWGSTWLSRALLPFYFDLLKNQHYLGLITCYRELGDLIQERTKIEKIQTIPVPMQASIARVNRNINHYPDAYQSIVDAIRPPRQGAIYIIAAGILSKSYGTIVKNRGGIAIDVGSVADVWMGAKTRPGVVDSFIDRWKLS